MIPEAYAVFILLCALLWRMGGDQKAGWSGYRDLLIPLLLAGWYSISISRWMLLEALPASLIRLGYGAWDPDNDPEPSLLAEWTHDHEGSLIRGIYGLLCSAAIGIYPAIITGHPWKYVLYTIGNGVLQYGLNRMRIPDEIEEPLTGAGLASVILCLR
jgi:hypothetical protein